jgi:hypothetical protein
MFLKLSLVGKQIIFFIGQSFSLIVELRLCLFNLLLDFLQISDEEEVALLK